MSATATPQQIDISNLPIEQLVLLKSQFEQELEQLTAMHEGLTSAIQQFRQTQAAVLETPTTAGQAMLVPLTGSLYAPGTTVDANCMLVDVGTGYFVDKTRAETEEYISRRLSEMMTSESQAQRELTMKRQSLKSITDLFEHKIRTMQAPQQQ